MNKKTEIKEFIINKIEEKSKLLGISFDYNEMLDDFSLTGTGIFDSMDFMNLIADVEENFNVEVDFTNHDPEIFTTINGFIQCIND
jgi:acyl carrier protein